MDPVLDVCVREPIMDPVLDVCVRESLSLMLPLFPSGRVPRRTYDSIPSGSHYDSIPSGPQEKSKQ